MATAPELLEPISPAVIRAMGVLDVPEVFAIERESYPFPWSAGIFRDCLRVGYFCQVITVEERICGYGVMSLGAGEVHILNLCIAEAQRSRGFGRSMLEHLLVHGAAMGMSEAFLEVRPSNCAALALYRSLGFEQVGLRRGYYQAVNGREDACVLKLTLRARRAADT
ncbi:MAG: ribosomal protein S18-alanine N-acetyltransferase [Steroidobacteraceae bacterium]